MVYETIAVCTYSAGQKTPFTKHVKIVGIGICPQFLLLKLRYMYAFATSLTVKGILLAVGKWLNKNSILCTYHWPEILLVMSLVF